MDIPGMATPKQYSNTADLLVERIKALIPEHPQILEMKEPWDLFKVSGFDCDDLGPSLFQASWALAKAIRDYKAIGFGCGKRGD